MRKQMIGYIAGLALFLLSGCDSFLTQLSENNTTVANHFRTEEDAEAAVYGMHAQFREVLGSFTQDYRDRGLLLDNFGLAVGGRPMSITFRAIRLQPWSSAGCTNTRP